MHQCPNPFLYKSCCVPFPWGWDILGPGHEDSISPCMHQSQCVLLCPISMGLGHIGTRMQRTDLSRCAPVPLCTSPIVSSFHGVGAHWDQDAGLTSLCVLQSHCVPVPFPWHWDTLGQGCRGLVSPCVHQSHYVPFSWGWDTLGPGHRGLISPIGPVCTSPTVPFPWDWDTVGPGHRGLISPCAHQSHCVPFSWGWDTLGPGRRGLISPCVHQSHFHGTGTQWDQGAWD